MDQPCPLCDAIELDPVLVDLILASTAVEPAMTLDEFRQWLAAVIATSP